MLRTIFLASFFCFLGTSTGRAEILSVKQAITLALQNNDLIRAASYQSDAARYGIAAAQSRYYPGITFNESLIASNAPTQAFMLKLDQGRFSQNDFLPDNLNHPATTHGFKTALTLNQPLFDPLAAPLLEFARSEAEGQDHLLESVKQAVGFRVFRSYLDVQKAQAKWQAAQQAVEQARESMRLATVRLEAGTGLRADELRARTHLSTAEQSEIAEHNNLVVARLRLYDLLGLKESEQIDVEVTVARVVPAYLPEELIRMAHEQSSDLKRMQNQVDKADAGISLARRAYLPAAEAFASYQLNARDVPFGADNDAWSAGINLKWQIFDGFKRHNESKTASASRGAAQKMLESKIREINLLVRESYLRREETGKRLEVARHALLDGEEAVRLISRRFENGLATMAELLDAQTVLYQLRAGLVEAESGYALAGGEVYHAAGLFLKEMTK